MVIPYGADDRIVVLFVSAPPETLGKLEPEQRAVEGAEGWRLNAAAADSAWIAEVREAFRRSIFFPTENLLSINVECYYPRPKSHYDRKGRYRLDAPLEVDGGACLAAVARAVFEALDGVVWKSRDQLVRFVVLKAYTDPDSQPSTLISVEKRPTPERTERRRRKRSTEAGRCERPLKKGGADDHGEG